MLLKSKDDHIFSLQSEVEDLKTKMKEIASENEKTILVIDQEKNQLQMLLNKTQQVCCVADLCPYKEMTDSQIE